MEHYNIASFSEADLIEDVYYVTERALKRTRKGDFYLDLTAKDATGSIRVKYWRATEELVESMKGFDFFRLRGRITSYNNQLQFEVEDISPVASDKVDLGDFQPTSDKDPSALRAKLIALLETITYAPLKQLADAFLADADFIDKLMRAPASMELHHPYVGGLIEHTTNVMDMAVKTADYYGDLDRDILLFGAFVHDIGKIYELGGGVAVDYTDGGRLLGHIVIGLEMLDEKLKEVKGLPAETVLLLKHLIVGHHGQRDWGSPQEPKTLEAVVLHYLDNLDAKIYGYLAATESASPSDHWTAYRRMFGGSVYKGPGTKFHNAGDE